ncbi:hypothetical protein GQ55_2G346000 [Panicum hallii var. hallii]|uniref:Uncharacterized protein n=1 Tax=Panicum hallii var. hallii TaxID=1504633 RepID=A0A2T7EVI7_9POAL|nr:hypothetical protein GQ55_2G346000 [Panicum hallii var. hallii]
MHDGALKATAAESYCIPDVCRTNGVLGSSIWSPWSCAELTGVVSFSKWERRRRSELPKCLLIFPRARHAHYFLGRTKRFVDKGHANYIVYNIPWFTCCGF